MKAVESLTVVAHTWELSTQLSVMDRLLLERMTELQAVQAFLTRVDAVLEAELVGMVDNLNSLISSASGAISNTWAQNDPVPGMRIEDPDLKEICDNLGSLMVEQIAARNYIAVTVAIQMHLCGFIEEVTSGWGGGEVAWTLREIYGMISSKGEVRVCI